MVTRAARGGVAFGVPFRAPGAHESPKAATLLGALGDHQKSFARPSARTVISSEDFVRLN
jgi:hypothetical protein